MVAKVEIVEELGERAVLFPETATIRRRDEASWRTASP
jgi:hypothetical protein